MQVAAGPPDVDLVWTATSGSGVTGFSSIDAANGDMLTLSYIVTADAAGLSAVFLSLEFDTALDDELNLISATETCTLVTSCGGLTQLNVGVESTQESTLAVEGNVLTMEAATGVGPVSSTFTLATVDFLVNNVATDGDDVFSGIFNVGIDGLFDNFSNDLSGVTTFNNASVNAPPAAVPEPSTLLLLGSGLAGLV